MKNSESDEEKMRDISQSAASCQTGLVREPCEPMVQTNDGDLMRSDLQELGYSQASSLKRLMFMAI